MPTRVVRTATGLIVPVGALQDHPLGQREIQCIALSQGVLLGPAAFVPTMLGQIFVVADQAALGLPVSTLDDVRAHVRRLRFTDTIAVVANVAARLWLIRSEPSRQRVLLEQLVRDPRTLAAYDRFLAGQRNDLQERLYVLSEQQLQVLQRLVIEEAAEGEDGAWNPEGLAALEDAFLGVTSVVGDGAARVHSDERRLEDWLGFLTQNGAFNEGGQPLYSLVRAHRLFIELPRTTDARRHPRACDFDAWIKERYGLAAEDLFAAGFLAQATTVLSEGSEEDGRVPGLLPPMSSYLSTTRLAARAAAIEAALSAPREFFVEGFAKSRSNPLRLTWDGTPFLQRPLVRLADGRMALTAPRALHVWLTDGWYYRLLDIAISKGERDAFTTFVGFLFERYVLELFELALPGRPAGSGRVHGEQAYSGGQMTSDVTVDYGEDLLLFEVISRRLPLGVRTEADPQELETHLQWTLLDKLEQLDRVSTDILAGRASIPGVDPAGVRRIWPILVTAGDFTESEPLWAWLQEHLPVGTFADPRVAQLTLLGVGDIEAIAGLVGAGEDLHDIIASKARSDHRELSLARWLTDTREGDPPRHPGIVARWNHLVAAMNAALVITPS